MRVLSAALPAAAVLVCALAPTVRGDQFVDRANAVYSTIRPEKRSDVVILPALLKLQPVPAAVNSVRKAKLLPASSADFKAAADWATAAPQQATLEALAKIAVDKSPQGGFAFGQPYGDQAVASGPGGVELVRAGLYTDLGDPPLLAAAQFRYLEALDRLVILAQVEATRRAAEGKPDAAISVLTDLVFLGRQMTDRAFIAEARWGYLTMSGALERVRDVAYVDFRSGSPKLSPEQILAFIDRIREDGFMRTDLIAFPQGERIGADQAVAASFKAGGGPNPATFPATMARLGSTQQPLRLFAEAARWGKVGELHADQKATSQRIESVSGDFARRWQLQPWDPAIAITPEYDRLPKTRFAAITTAMPSPADLFNDRQLVRAQLVGARHALATLGFFARAKNFPPDITSLRPAWVKALEADPYNADRIRGKVPPLEYFVPVRDAGRGAPGSGPAEINVVSPGIANFRVSIGQDQFIMYSVGPDGLGGFARDVSGEPERSAAGDLLIWPPVISLVRQRLVETGQLK